jgi:hypothetical protein
VKAPRFRIAWIMVAVAIAAFDFGAIREMYGSATGELLMLGALPMANVLAVGILVSQRRPGRRPFLLGFEAFGAMALALYVAMTIYFIEHAEPNNSYLILLTSYLALLVAPIEKNIGRGRPFVFFPILCFVYVAMLGWPQVVFALIGGFLSRRFKITITRR